MKNPTAIKQQAAPAPGVPGIAPEAQSLTESETNILKLLVTERDEANNNIATFVGHVMNARKLDVKEWGISIQDFKTIIKNQPVSAPSTPPLPTNPNVG